MDSLKNKEQDLFSLLPRDVQLEIFQKLTPQEKKVVALVSKEWRILAELPGLLLNDFKSRKYKFSLRQLSILLGIKEVVIERDQEYILVKVVARNLQFNKLPIISEEKLVLLLNAFESNGIPDSHSQGFNGIPDSPSQGFRWLDPFSRLIRLEKSFRLSADFSLEKAVVIFSQHIQFMKGNGFDVNKKLFFLDTTPLFEAVLYGNPILLKALLQQGAKVDQTLQVLNIEEQAIHRLSFKPVFDFPKSQELQIDCLKILIEFGADPNAIQFINSREEKKTPLWFAAFFGLDKVVEALVGFGANVDHDSHDEFEGSTPLQTAINGGFFNTVKTLIKLGADPKKKDSKQQTAIDFAKQSFELGIAKYLEEIVSPSGSNQ